MPAHENSGADWPGRFDRERVNLNFAGIQLGVGIAAKVVIHRQRLAAGAVGDAQRFDVQPRGFVRGDDGFAAKAQLVHDARAVLSHDGREAAAADSRVRAVQDCRDGLGHVCAPHVRTVLQRECLAVGRSDHGIHQRPFHAAIGPDGQTGCLAGNLVFIRGEQAQVVRRFERALWKGNSSGGRHRIRAGAVRKIGAQRHLRRSRASRAEDDRQDQRAEVNRPHGASCSAART